MIELQNDNLHFMFPEVHPDAQLNISFQRTLRVPDDDKEYPLPENETLTPAHVVQLRNGM